jgi:hypothetical protein
MKLFIGIPCQQGFSVEFNAALMNFVTAPTVRYRISICKSPGVGVSRNILTKEFLDSDADKLLMLDADILFTPGHIQRISSHDEPLVGGLYSKKDVQGNVCCERLPDVEPMPDERGLIPLRYIGTGFMCATRDLLNRMIKQFPEIMYIQEGTSIKMHDFWSVGVHQGSKRYLTEDWWFCQRATDLGYKIWGDSQVMLQHEGRAIYPLELNES